jgi:drug/metabolite transporter (DMT)-like permease
MTHAKAMTPKEWGLLIALSVLWGGSFFFNGIAVKALPPFSIVTLRVGLAAVVLFALTRILGLAMPKGGRIWANFFGMGLLNNLIPFCLIVWGQTHIASSLAAILNATTPLFAVLVAHVLTQDEKLTPNRLAGVAIGFLGVAVMIGPEALGGLGSDLLAQSAVLGGALSYALAGIFGRRFRRMGIPPLVTATGQVTAATVMLAPVALLVDHPWTLAAPDWRTWAAIGGIAVFSTALAYVLYFRILATAGATNLMLVTLLIPVSAMLLGALILGERIGAKHLVGMALIAAGLAAIDGRLLAAFRRRRPVPAG